KTKSKKISINTRILVSILILLGAIFLGIVVSFNILVDTYIQKSTNEQLKSATESVQRFDTNLILEKPLYNFNKMKPNAINRDVHPDTYSNFLRELQGSIKVGDNKYILEAMVINDDYELVFPTRKEDFLKDIDKYESILSEIKKEKYNLDSDKNTKISTENSSYYVSVVKINSLDTESNLYAVLYIDISNILHIAQMMNVVLIVIMCIAGLLAIFTAILLSKQIGKPIQKLCGFAQNIGEGKFEKCNFDFADKELDELYQIMNKSVEQLDKYDKEQKIFFQNASHELRTPLMSIKGYAEAIKYNVIDKESASNVILEESDRLTDMVEDLLYISKIDNITKDFILTECDLREVLSNCVLKQKARAITKGIEFKYDFDENPVLFNCDEKS
ncbi:MAG: HAMP domain-containing sensor histidine kinase, partial [Peptostreptococcaceae bacterium]